MMMQRVTDDNGNSHWLFFGDNMDVPLMMVSNQQMARLMEAVLEDEDLQEDETEEDS